MSGEPQISFVPIELKSIIERYTSVLERVESKLDNQMYSIKQTVSRMNISSTTLYKLMDQNLLSFHSVGNKRLISEKQIQQYFKSVDSSQL